MPALNRETPAKPTGNDCVALAAANRRFTMTDGPVTLELVPNLIRLPAEHEQRTIDYHAVSRDSLGRIYVLYNSVDRTEKTRALARFHYRADESGKEQFVFDTLLGTREWANGTPHGLNINLCQLADGSEAELMTVVNNDGTIVVADLDCREIWRHSLSADGPQAPTSAVASKDADLMGVVDGYATNVNYIYSTSSGRLVKSTGSEGSGDGQSKTNHGIDIDPDGRLVIADRGNTRLTWWTADGFEPLVKNGRHVTLEMPDLQVCNTSFLGRHAVVPCLNSKLAFIAPDPSAASGYRVVAAITMPPQLVAAGIDGIHDAEFTPDGRFVIVAVWERRRTERKLPTLTAFRVAWEQ